MKELRFLMICFLALVASNNFIIAEGFCGEKIYKMKGTITAIELVYQTVVVEVPMGKRMFTVGGPLATDAVVKKGKNRAELNDFKIGDSVIVKWKVTEKGHLILFLDD